MWNVESNFDSKHKSKFPNRFFNRFNLTFINLELDFFFHKRITGMALDCYLILQNPFFTNLKKNNQSSIRLENFNIFRSASALGGIQQLRGLEEVSIL